MDREKLLYAIGEVDEDVLNLKYGLKQIMWALLMGTVTMILCLFVAERLLGVSGFVMDVTYLETGDIQFRIDPNLKIGLWFRRICLIIITLLFAGKVRWRYTWVNLFLYFGLYFPLRALAEPWPVMGYMGSGDGILAFPWIINTFLMMAHFWGVQSLVYLVYNIVVWLYRKWKKTD